MLHNIGAGYAPQHAKLARILRGTIESGACQRGDALPGLGPASRKHKIGTALVGRSGPPSRSCRHQGLT
jgi:hypothetical protein